MDTLRRLWLALTIFPAVAMAQTQNTAPRGSVNDSGGWSWWWIIAAIVVIAIIWSAARRRRGPPMPRSP